MDITIRHELESDQRQVEIVTREAFWNLYVPGCDEHYLVHIMREHQDFIPELNFVAIYEGNIIGNIMYTKSYLIDDSDPSNRLDIITFGPVCVLPEYQRRGVGSKLIGHTLKIAKENDYKAVIIQGHPGNYCKHGFKSSKDFGISDSDGKYPYSLLALELEKGVFKEKQWKYYSSDVYEVDSKAAEKFDTQFEPKKKEYSYTQEEFFIACRAYLP